MKTRSRERHVREHRVRQHHGDEQHVSPLVAMLYPGYTKRCDGCGGLVATTPEEALRQWTETAADQITQLGAALSQPTAGSPLGMPTVTPYDTPGSDWTRGLGPYGHHHAHHDVHHRHRHHHGCGCDDDCGCHDCHHDDCHCECCVINADLVVNARLGERRVVPLTVENSRRREREVTLELSQFTSRGGKPAQVTGRLVPPTEFTLTACEEREVILVVDVGGQGQDGVDVIVKAETTSKAKAATDGGQVVDVDDCEVAYADLTVTGCDIRPLRIAVSALPRDCHAYPVDCGCGCC